MGILNYTIKMSNLCKGNTIFDTVECSKINNRSNCENKKNFAGLPRCNWHGSANEPYCKGNDQFSDITCGPIKDKNNCKNNCTWVDPNSVGTCKGKTIVNENVCSKIEKAVDCVNKKDTNGVSMCNWEEQEVKINPYLTTTTTIKAAPVKTNCMPTVKGYNLMKKNNQEMSVMTNFCNQKTTGADCINSKYNDKEEGVCGWDNILCKPTEKGYNIINNKGVDKSIMD